MFPRIFLILFLALCGGVLVSDADARVIRESPDFTWLNDRGEVKTLRSLRGQAVVILIAPSPRDWKFRSQVGQLQRAYQRFAAENLVCFAAFSKEGGTIRSNIPFVLPADGPRVAFLYEATSGFAIAVIGPDGNLDYLTTKVIPAQRLLDILNNSFSVQEYLRRP